MAHLDDNLLLQLDGVAAHFGQHQVLRDMSLSVAAGETIVLIGPNGGGKSTLLKIMGGLLQPSAGRIQRRQSLSIAYVPQTLILEKTMPLTVLDFVTLCQPFIAGRLSDVLGELDIEHLLRQNMLDLSGGEFQRVLLARALLKNPALLLLDEPTQGMDMHAEAEFYRTLASFSNRTGCSVVVVSHDLHWVMAQARHVYCIRGHICCHGAPEAIAQNPAYLSLFSEQAPAAGLAPYVHQHNHSHDD